MCGSAYQRPSFRKTLACGKECKRGLTAQKATERWSRPRARERAVALDGARPPRNFVQTSEAPNARGPYGEKAVSVSRHRRAQVEGGPVLDDLASSNDGESSTSARSAKRFIARKG
jgi:hypothetical protein